MLPIKTLKLHPTNFFFILPVRNQRRRQWNDIRINQAIVVLLATVVAVAHVGFSRGEDPVDAYEATVVVPCSWVFGEVAEEDEDGEGAAESEPEGWSQY